MQKKNWFIEKIEKFKDDPEFIAEGIILEFTEKIVSIMQEKNINRAELAKRLGVSKAFVTKLLNGNPNLTIKSMVSIAKTLGCELNIDIFPEGFEIKRYYTTSLKRINIEEYTEAIDIITEGDADAVAA